MRAGLLGDDGSLADYAWSSFPQYLKPASAVVCAVDGGSVAWEEGHPERQCAGSGGALKIELAAELRKSMAVSMVWIVKELNEGRRRVFGLR